MAFKIPLAKPKRLHQRPTRAEPQHYALPHIDLPSFASEDLSKKMMIGRGAYGTVYRVTYRGEVVVYKAINDPRPDENLARYNI
jgi:hypothetical protein